jgi:hypothetical protein
VPPAARIQAGRSFDAESPVSRPEAMGLLDDHPGFVLAGPREHVVGGVAVDQAERAAWRMAAMDAASSWWPQA